MKTEYVSPAVLAGAVYECLGQKYPNHVRTRLEELRYPYGEVLNDRTQQQFAVRVLCDFWETVRLHQTDFSSDEELLLATITQLGFGIPPHFSAEAYLFVIGGFLEEQLVGFDSVSRSHLDPLLMR